MLIVFLLSTARIAAADKINALDNDTDTEPVNLNASDAKHAECENDTLPFDTFLHTLVETSKEQLHNVVENIKKYYNLSDKDKVVNSVNSTDLYEYTLQHNLKKIIKDNKFNASDEFMLDFIDLSNFILAKTIETILKTDRPDQLTDSNWKYKEKIIRQQSKMSTTFIENTICNSLSLCKDINKYSEYLTVLLRGMMDLTPSKLNILFEAIPKVLSNYKDILRTNVNLREYVNYLANADFSTQRDALDLLDEILSNPKDAFEHAQKNHRRRIGILIELFEILNKMYDLNAENNTQLEKVALIFEKWIDGEENVVEEALRALISNLWLNIKIWPLSTQSEINYTWSKAIRD